MLARGGGPVSSCTPPCGVNVGPCGAGAGCVYCNGDDGQSDGGYDGGVFAGAGGPSISPLEGNPYDEDVEAVVDGFIGNISGSVGADAGFIGAGVFAFQGVPGILPDNPLDFNAYGDLNFGPCTNYVEVNCGVPVPANNGTQQQPQQPQQPKPPSVPWWMTFKLASHSEPPIQPTCQSAAIAGVGTAALYGPWVEGPLAWAAYFGGNALGIYGLAKC